MIYTPSTATIDRVFVCDGCGHIINLAFDQPDPARCPRVSCASVSLRERKQPPLHNSFKDRYRQRKAALALP